MTGEPLDPAAIKLDPIDATVVGPGLTAIPLAPTVWDDAEDGQYAVDSRGIVWVRREGIWYRDPWWQDMDTEEIVSVCANPAAFAYNMGWPQHHVENTYGPLQLITLPEADQ